MPQVTSRSQIRAILDRDRPWASYALADLEPGFFEHSKWFVSSADAPAIVLLYSAFSMPVLVLVGAAHELEPVLDEVGRAAGDAREVFFAVRPETLPLLSRRYQIREAKPMIRMLLDPGRFHRGNEPGVVRLGPTNLQAVQALYRDGEARGETPDFFLPAMLDDGFYFGVREGDALVAVAGTHVVARRENVAGLGNIYTRRDRRRLGLCERATSAVISTLLEMQVATVVLNVRADNDTAIRIYARLGFEHYCDYFEAVASKRF